MIIPLPCHPSFPFLRHLPSPLLPFVTFSADRNTPLTCRGDKEMWPCVVSLPFIQVNASCNSSISRLFSEEVTPWLSSLTMLVKKQPWASCVRLRMSTSRKALFCILSVTWLPPTCLNLLQVNTCCPSFITRYRRPGGRWISDIIHDASSLLFSNCQRMYQWLKVHYLPISDDHYYSY